MTDTTAPTQTQSWLVVVQGLMPSLNQALVIAVTASVTFVSTLAMQVFVAPMSMPAADKPAPVSVQKQINDAVNRIDGQLANLLTKVGETNDRLGKIEGKRDLALDYYEAMRRDYRTPQRPASPAAKASTAK